MSTITKLFSRAVEAGGGRFFDGNGGGSDPNKAMKRKGFSRIKGGPQVSAGRPGGVGRPARTPRAGVGTVVDDPLGGY